MIDKMLERVNQAYDVLTKSGGWNDSVETMSGSRTISMRFTAQDLIELRMIIETLQEKMKEDTK